MAYQPVPDTAEFRIVGQVNGGAIEVINTLYVRNTLLPWTVAHLLATAVVIGNRWDDTVATHFSSTYVFDKVECRDLGVEFGNVATQEYNVTGGVVGTPLSAAICVYTEFRCAGGSAPRTGGNFVSPFSEADLTVDVWGAGLVTEIDDMYTDIKAALEGQANGDAWVVPSRYSKNAVPTPPHRRTTAVTNLVSDVVTKTPIAIQRDRRLGQGS